MRLELSELHDPFHGDLGLDEHRRGARLAVLPLVHPRPTEDAHAVVPDTHEGIRTAKAADTTRATGPSAREVKMMGTEAPITNPAASA